MKRVVILCVLLSACATPRMQGRGVILTSFQPLYSFTTKIVEGSSTLEVFNLAPRHLGPHDFAFDDPAFAAQNREMARRALAVVTLRSLPLAKKFDQLYPFCRLQNIRIVEIDPVVTWDPSLPRLALIPNPSDTFRAGKVASAVEPVANPHVWLSLNCAARLVERIRQDVSALDPANAALYERNAFRFQGDLRALKAEYEKALASIDNLLLVALTEAFPYLTSEFALNVVDYILEPAGPKEVGDRIRSAGVNVVLDEKEPEDAVVQAVNRAGAKLVVLSTLEEGWGEGEQLDPDGYLKGMRENLSRLLVALKTAEPPLQADKTSGSPSGLAPDKTPARRASWLPF